ncbi:hypothetical protein EYB25_004476 [Talaromyces marneffei]|uniref:Asparagine amidohydrolase, putative n=1 Tax=Talaromyces marneffei (strain ATCC 18224 / CBS 334.59 / QM 7333) TaxID=441960 RepID=B6QG07_TALMQ|nr:uncharacterized protein EYB26_004442 [Talaromyces marneffei]EEA24392.1 asparagine amidohydrolase, putative [Talaromyces marneffei ATCC 18224]KAE8553097.1 hypothetical protein EYB25_004476 [Talaromyces marneffei]QGA16772.1 hypothetical protein EYB26_004442 [Talaromyces marneffei]
MRIATLQFAPRLGDVEGNIKRADMLLRLTPPEDGDGLHFVDGKPGIEELHPDILVLPEMAFSGYNFPSLEAITPYLEYQGKGPSALWAQRTARRLKCKVCVGYPEIYRNPEVSSVNGTNENGLVTSPAKLYNSLVVVDEAGQVIHNYRKRFLYYTDDSWASEGEAEWSFKSLEFHTGMSDVDTTAAAIQPQTTRKSIQIPTTFGICMDINPYKFEAPWDAYEFAHRVLDSQSHLVILSAAWLTTDADSLALKTGELPDMDTFNYWLRRFWPLIEQKINYGDRQLEGFDSSTETKVIIVFANRTGMEDGGPGCVIPHAVYAGTSTIVAITQKKDSSALDVKIHCWGIKGAREEGICFADTESEPEMAFVMKKIGDSTD